MSRVLQGLAIAGLCVGNATAFEIPSDNSDMTIRWDNTIKYNIGWRMQGRDKTLADTWGLQAGEYKFDKGDVITNRIDVLSEFDAVYKQHNGVRISAALWSDFAYDNKVRGNPALQAAGLGTSYPGNVYTHNVERWYTKSGEILDAFAFTRFGSDEHAVDVKLGRHTTYWGESLFTPIHGVSYSQSPVDFRKALATPGSEAKELFLPLNQLSGQAQVTDNVTVAAQYYLEWKPYRIYEGGTYFTYFDFCCQGGTNYLGTQYHGTLDSGPFAKPKNSGSWGVNTKWASQFGTLGLYYRKFDDKIANIISDGRGGLVDAYATDVKLLGVSLSKEVGGVAVSGELVHRKNTALNSVFGGAGVARGDTWHAVANAMAFFGKTPLYDSAVLLAELTYSRLDKAYDATKAFYSAEGYTCIGPTLLPNGTKRDGCSTKDALGFSMTFTPTWYQALPSVDVTMPIHYDRGLRGNSPVPFGGNEASGSWSIGLGADYLAKYKFDLAYNRYYGQYTAVPNWFAAVPGVGPSQLGSTNGGNAILGDRGWLSLTFKTTF